MLVYLVGARTNIIDRIETFRELVKTIHSEGHSLALDWIEPVYEAEKSGKVNDIEWPILYKDMMEAIARADVVIADTSVQSFGVGYQTAMAIQLKKPTLILHHDSTSEYKFLTGIDNVNVDYKSFNDTNIEDILRSFLKVNDIPTKDMRFNFFIDRPIYNYLRWSSLKTGKTKAEILRELVEREIEREKS